MKFNLFVKYKPLLNYEYVSSGALSLGSGGSLDNLCLGEEASTDPVNVHIGNYSNSIEISMLRRTRSFQVEEIKFS